MLARDDLATYVTDHYGTCTRAQTAGGENACYWGKDARGSWNGCLRTGWRGTACPHWRPVDGAAFDEIYAALK